MTQANTTDLVTLVATLTSNTDLSEYTVCIGTTEGERTIVVTDGESAVVANAVIRADKQIVDKNNKAIADGTYAMSAKRFKMPDVATDKPKKPLRAKTPGAGSTATSCRSSLG